MQSFPTMKRCPPPPHEAKRKPKKDHSCKLRKGGTLERAHRKQQKLDERNLAKQLEYERRNKILLSIGWMLYF